MPVQQPMMPTNPIPGINPMLLGQKPKIEHDDSCSLYVGNLTSTTFDNDLFKFFHSKGYKIKGARVMFDNNTKRSKNHGYLNFYSKEDAEKCLAEMNNAICDGKQIVLNKKKNSEFDSEANILIRNLPKEMSQNELFNMFKSFGNIISCKIETNKKDG